MKATARINGREFELNIINDSKDLQSVYSVDFESDVFLYDENSNFSGRLREQFDSFCSDNRELHNLEPTENYTFKISLIDDLEFFKKGVSHIEVVYEKNKSLIFEWLTSNEFIVDDKFRIVPNSFVNFNSKEEFEAFAEEQSPKTKLKFFSRVWRLFKF